MKTLGTGFHYTSNDGLNLYSRIFESQKANAPAVLCLHGLTRNSRDFVELAAHLQRHYRVVAADIRGRGHSAYDPQWQNYHPGTYVNDMWLLVDALQLSRVVVIGTSLGALMAMMMAAQKPATIAGI